ncbi:hypothetical protein HBA54_28475 [Pelagibius litoralis]|uniref:Uncharacterized protein n=1 Tax=Pelagibius litoralis TaxID=374515 RepID=A0A967F3Q2_9PROT|nr:hypothetical protein [Pelagibius litoralis]NIA72530.1 hypothetical protein [Pelagibius litoralis]
MPRALSQNLETIAALQSFCIFGYQTDDPLTAVAQQEYFLSCASRLMTNDLILVCADVEQEPAWGLFLISGVDPDGVQLQNVAGLTPDTINGLTFLRSALVPTPSKRAKAATAAKKSPRKAA